MALVEIRESRLYRGQYESFDDYCRERWGMSKTHANRLIASASTVNALGDVEVLPANEAQVRPLTLLPPDRQKEAWEKAVQTVGGVGKITAAVVQQVVEDMLRDGKAVVFHKPPSKVRFIDRDRFLEDLLQWCSRHQLVLPKRVIDYIRKY